MGETVFTLTGRVLIAEPRTTDKGVTYVDVYVKGEGQSPIVQCYANAEDLKGELPEVGAVVQAHVVPSARVDRFSGGAQLSVRIVSLTPALASV